MRNTIKFIFGLILGVALIPSVVAADEATSSQPNIQTYNSATSSTVIITAPSGYQSSVVSTYDGNQFHTVATSTPLTPADIKKMQDNLRAQQDEMNKMFQDEQSFFTEQNKMFENFMNGTPLDATPTPAAPKKITPRAPKITTETSAPVHSVATSPEEAGTTSPALAPVVENKPSFFDKIIHFFNSFL